MVFTAKDPAGNTGTATANVTFRAGIEGYVTAEGEAATPIAGAQVTLVSAAGAAVATAVSGADGAYAIDLSQVPATFTLRVSAPGYAAYEAEVAVTADARLVWSAALIAGDGTPAVRLLSPVNGEVVVGETVRVTGVVSGFKAERIEVNQQRTTADAAGHFEVEVPVAIGENALQALAARADGMVVRDQLTVTRVDVDTLVNDRRVVTGSCAAAPGAPLFLLGLWLLALGRRRAARG